MITAYITRFNNILIDPTTCINSGVYGYIVHFEFQEDWNSTSTLQAIFKPVNDVPVHIDLDEHNNCVIPPQIYRRFAKLGVGLRSFNKNRNIVEKATSLFYIPIRYSGDLK